MTEEKPPSSLSTLQHLLAVYEALIQSKQVQFPISDVNRRSAESIVKTVEGSYFGAVRYQTPEAKVAAYFFLIIKDHPFFDGNKRTAVLVAATLCELWGLPPLTADRIGIAMSAFAVSVERIQLTDELPETAIESIRTILFPDTPPTLAPSQK